MSMDYSENFGKELPVPVVPSPTQAECVERIKALIKENPIVLFMKGNSQAPRCGFSANVVNILNKFQRPFATYDILKDSEIRNTLKEYNNWPTYPQLYINQQFIGGNDIVSEMDLKGDLKSLIL